MTKQYTINAENKSIGRVATRVAMILRGKTTPEYKPNVAPNIRVKIMNIKKAVLTGNKMATKSYIRHTGYPGGQRNLSFKTKFEKDPEGAFKKIVERMLPKNRLRKIMLNNLKVESK